MDKDRKRELIQQYKQTRPLMGILIIQSSISNKCCLQTAKNMNGAINGTRFRLDTGTYVNKELQKEWKEFGSENFKIEVLEYLEYDKDESKTDYSEDLALLQSIWEEKLAKENVTFYKKALVEIDSGKG